METVPGDKFIDDCARYIRFNESKLSPSISASSINGNVLSNPISWLFAATPTPPPPSAASSSSPTKRRPIRDVIRPTALRLTSHHLYYLLIRFEAIGLSIGPLDVQIPSTSRPSSYFAFISNNAAGSGMRRKDRQDSMSISSLQTTMSALSIFGSSARGNGSNSGGWWSGKKPDISIDVKYIYSALTKIPSLRIGPPPLKLIQDFEDCPGELSIPLDIFKSVQVIEFEDVDPRAFIGWDRLSIQLRSFSIKRSGIEDITDIIIDAVVQDAKRRRGERVRHRKRKVHAPIAVEEEVSSREESQGIVLPPSSESSDTISEKQLPSLSWHFLRHLSLSDNSLTFLHTSCLSCLTSLTSLDLSNNLMNAVPPSLNLIPNLQSLNLTNNLIDSVMGIPLALPNIKALNLSHNRLESLCGLERLPTLVRIDLRKNEIYEAGEIGRLATIPGIVEIYIAGNPLLEEVEDARVDVFAEFAKEGRNIDAIQIDGEGIGFFERQRVRDKVPNLDRIAISRRGREMTPSADEDLTRDGISNQTEVKSKGEMPITEGKNLDGPIVKTVRHRQSHSQQVSNSKAAQRRNRRVVEILEDSASTSANGESSRSSGPKSDVPEEISDSDAIKKAALAGDTEVAIGAVIRSNSLDASGNNADSNAGVKKQGTADESDVSDQFGTIKPGPRKRNGLNSLQRDEDSAEQNISLTNDVKNGKVSTTSMPDSTDEQDIRRKIEALKGEVGDDWLRLMSRGESVYVTNSEDGDNKNEEGAEQEEE